jgi:hypothetical protein
MVTILTNILTDEINDPKGRVSAAQDYNYLNAKEMPKWANSLYGAASSLPQITDSLDDRQADNLYKLARYGSKSAQLMADPLANQGQNEFGVNLMRFPEMANLSNQANPRAVLSTIRAQDLMQNRGLDIKPFETATPLQVEMAMLNSQAANNPGASGEYTNQHAGEKPFNPYNGDMLAPLKPLHPDEMISMLGFDQANLGAKENTPQLMKLYGVTADNPMPEALKKAYDWIAADQGEGRSLYSPDIMEKLYAIKPGESERGVLDIMASRPGYAGSRLAGVVNDSPTPTFAHTAQDSGPPQPPPNAPKPPGDQALNIIEMLAREERDRQASQVGGG